jgi:Ca-activated chloride channel homolog
MNTQTLISIVIALAVLTGACSAPTSVAPYRQPAQAQPTAGAYPTFAPPPTSAPAPTQVFLPTEAPAQAVYPTPAPTSGPLPIGAAPALTATPAWAPATPPADNTFRDYGVNPYVDAARNHLSTFALDVDTAAYTVARRYVQDGNVPPAEAVRVEEFVNFFKQDYPLPPDIAFGIYADGAPSPFQRDGAYLVRFGIQGYAVPDAQRKPLNLTFVIDVSGSMSEQGRMDMVKQSLNLLVNRLRPSDTVAIIAFTTQAWVVLNPTNGGDREAILNAIGSLQPLYTTNVEAGLRLGYQQAAQMYQAGATNRVILCSDGVANVGATDPAAILEFVHGYTAEGITLTSVGVGMGNFNDVLLEQLADKGAGNYAYVDTLEEAQRVLVDNLVSTMQIIAQDAKVQVDFNPDVVARYRLIGYEDRAVANSDFRNNAVAAGGIGAGHAATALYAVQLRPGTQGRLATVQLRWADPETHQVTEINGNFNTWDLALAFEKGSPRYQLDVVAAEYAEVLRHSPWAEGVSLSEVARYASRLPELLPADPDVAEFAQLVSRAANLEQ